MCAVLVCHVNMCVGGMGGWVGDTQPARPRLVACVLPLAPDRYPLPSSPPCLLPCPPGPRPHRAARPRSRTAATAAGRCPSALWCWACATSGSTGTTPRWVTCGGVCGGGCVIVCGGGRESTCCLAAFGPPFPRWKDHFLAQRPTAVPSPPRLPTPPTPRAWLPLILPAQPPHPPRPAGVHGH